MPAGIAAEVAQEAVEATAYEDFVEAQVKQGRRLPGLYPATPESRAEFERWRAHRVRAERSAVVRASGLTQSQDSIARVPRHARAPREERGLGCRSRPPGGDRCRPGRHRREGPAGVSCVGIDGPAGGPSVRPREERSMAGSDGSSGGSPPSWPPTWSATRRLIEQDEAATLAALKAHAPRADRTAAGRAPRPHRQAHGRRRPRRVRLRRRRRGLRGRACSGPWPSAQAGVPPERRHRAPHRHQPWRRDGRADEDLLRRRGQRRRAAGAALPSRAASCLRHGLRPTAGQARPCVRVPRRAAGSRTSRGRCGSTGCVSERAAEPARPPCRCPTGRRSPCCPSRT